MSFEQTTNFQDYKLYQKVKARLIYKYKGVNITAGSAFTLLNLIVFKRKISCSEVFRAISRLFLKLDREKIEYGFTQHKTVLSEMCFRPEHINLLEKIQNQLDQSILLPFHPHKLKVFPKISELIKILIFSLKNEEIDFLRTKEKFFLSLELAYYCHQIDLFEQVFRSSEIKCKNYIPLNSSVGLEAVITLFLNIQGIITYHIFHGIFGRYKLKIANDIINGENITAKKILAFSENTRKDLIRDFNICPGDIEIAGNPKYAFRTYRISNKRFQKCLVLNGYNYYDDAFLGLLKLLNDISSESGIRFIIKPHPNSRILNSGETKSFKNLTFIREKINLNNLLMIESFDFSIAFNTVTYYECLYNNLLSLRYSIDENIDFIGLDDKFFDRQTFFERLETFHGMSPDLLAKQYEELLSKTLGAGINRYKEIIDQNI
jgi:hypothetical protein